jgi:7-cyano-7-deazaguanine reductase
MSSPKVGPPPPEVPPEYLDSLKSLGESKTEYLFDRPEPDLLERFPAPGADDSKYEKSVVFIQTDEFTSLCPKTGQPDWARIIIAYKPELYCVESKSLKLYLMGFRNHGEFHESCIHRIRNDLVNEIEPTWLVV